MGPENLLWRGNFTYSLEIYCDNRCQNVILPIGAGTLFCPLWSVNTGNPADIFSNRYMRTLMEDGRADKIIPTGMLLLIPAGMIKWCKVFTVLFTGRKRM